MFEFIIIGNQIIMGNLIIIVNSLIIDNLVIIDNLIIIGHLIIMGNLIIIDHFISLFNQLRFVLNNLSHHSNDFSLNLFNSKLFRFFQTQIFENLKFDLYKEEKIPSNLRI